MLKLLEYEAKEYFMKYGIPTPAGKMVTSSEATREYTAGLGKPVVIKIQLPIGGRGKAGGVKFADTPDETAEAAGALLAMTIKDMRVRKLYVEEKVGIVNEIYLGVTVDRNSKKHVILASSEGGMDIEVRSAATPRRGRPSSSRKAGSRNPSQDMSRGERQSQARGWAMLAPSSRVAQARLTVR
jgi:succinyl-CoA synthetase beta subunit